MKTLEFYWNLESFLVVVVRKPVGWEIFPVDRLISYKNNIFEYWPACERSTVRGGHDNANHLKEGEQCSTDQVTKQKRLNITLHTTLGYSDLNKWFKQYQKL